ncbi:hypothetical protein IV203_023935 [Nitzschia inconspicua]|uniref:PDZ domain-containing protein n=1 Tax=Nitzschia inconspicua TaxID=303405 RepID=A0A9K3PAI7_9STRA|nr:hypothetical protein IV203_023935 [Nitzschia inconspicua]
MPTTTINTTSLLFYPGDVVETTYGVGVVVTTTRTPPPTTTLTNNNNDTTNNNILYQVLLWRIPGQSIASSTVAYLQSSAIRSNKKLPAAPGMITYLKDKKDDTDGSFHHDNNNNNNNNNNKNNTEIVSSSSSSSSSSSRQPYMVQAYYSDRNCYRIVSLEKRRRNRNLRVPSSQNENLETNTVVVDDYGSDADDNNNDTSRRLSRLSLLSSINTNTTTTAAAAATSSSSNSNDNYNDDDTGGVVVVALEVSPEQLEMAPSATFYPLLCQLMKRGDEAAHATQGFLHDKTVSHVVQQATQLGQETTKQALEALEKQVNNTTIITTNNTTNNTTEQQDNNDNNDILPISTTTSTTTSTTITTTTNLVLSEDIVKEKVKTVANNQQVLQLVTMLKTEDLTVLLEKGKERLEQLLQNDIPQATKKTLEQTGIRIFDDSSNDNDNNNNNNTNNNNYKTAMIQSRKAALQALQKVLEDKANVNQDDWQAMQRSLSDNFGTLLDSWQEAAKSDRNLAALLENVNERTAAWQEATGRLLQTRSASIFLDGASRIHARAKTLLSKEQLQWAGEVGSKFTKAFTEGDAAVARLKTIELGDTIRDRLVTAIEVRSESLGGLDGIIAGALTTMKNVGNNTNNNIPNGSADQMKDMLTKLQSNASNFTKDANETLISVLARQSEYRDVALLQLEQVLCDLRSQFGEDLSPQDIAAVANGEGGTARLFEPIAKRAAKEIEKQLDVAESSVSDPTMLDVLKHVRKIVSGELTMGAVLDEMVNILNDDKVVAAGENLVKHGEQVLDAIEGVNANKMVDDVMNIAEKAGITKDTVMEGIENLDVNELLDNAGNAITDEKARQKLLSDATDTALDFILRILPSMPVPPVEGVKDGLVYHISNLSMEGFKVRKENILVEIAGMRATKKGPKTTKNTQPTTIIERLDDSASLEEETGCQKEGGIQPAGSFDSQGMDFDTTVDENVVVKATELLIIDVREVSAIMNGVAWSFEQTYMPYLKGSGKFDVRMSEGAIRLVFELRKRPKLVTDQDGNKQTVWVPVLCLHDRFCSIGAVEFNMQGGTRLAWVINKVASVFKNLLRDYVVRTIIRIMTDKSGWILSQLNEGLNPFWDVLLRTAKLSIDDLERATQKDIMEATPVPKTALIELVWRERLPLGMNLLLNDDSGLLKVVDFPRGSQARTVCEKRNLDPESFKGATITAVNGIKYATEDELFEALRDPGRPKTIQFELAESEDAERIRKFVEESQALDNPNKKHRHRKSPTSNSDDRLFSTRSVVFTDPMDLGLEFANAPDNVGLVVRRFLETDDGLVLAAARNQDKIHTGDILTHINGTCVLGENGSGRIKALKLLEEVGGKRPLSLTFSDPYLHPITYEKSARLQYDVGGPKEVVLKEDKEAKRILLEGFEDVDGCSELAGVMLGDYLVFLNGMTVGAGCRWMGESTSPPLSQVEELLLDPGNYPIGLTFARPARQQDGDDDRWTAVLLGSGPERPLSMETSETICVTAEHYDQLGLELEQKEYNDIVVKDLAAIAGPFQMATSVLLDADTESYSHLSVDSINGEFVPAFATTQMVKSAMERSWKSDGRVEVIYCDMERKKFVMDLSDVAAS